MIDYLKKSKHEPTCTWLATLLGRLMKYMFDLNYLEGNKLKVLSRLYIEKKYKINNVIPLKFLLHFTDHQFPKQYMHLANSLYVHKKIKNVTRSRCNYDRKAKGMPIKRYQAPVIEKKTRHQPPGTHKMAQLPVMSPDTKGKPRTAVDKVIAIFEIGNQNPLQKDEIIDTSLTIKQDQIEKQVINTISNIPDEMYKPPHLLIGPQISFLYLENIFQTNRK